MSKQLKERLTESIQTSAEACLPFSEFMETSLYDEQEGYYATGAAIVGRSGDFITSVTVGKCFGHLLASHVIAAWQAMGKPSPFALIEQGAHDATLMSDLLEGLNHPIHGNEEAAKAVQAHIIEPYPAQRSRQEKTLNAHGNNANNTFETTWHPDLQSLAKLQIPGVFVCNELLDAFPVHRLRWREGLWRELGVSLDETGEFIEAELAEMSEELRSATELLPPNLPENYTTEINLAASEWIREIAQSGFRGHILAIDYGFSRADYYLPGRTDGSLQGYRDHKSITTFAEMASNPGECDLTTHVEFTSVAEAAVARGMSLAGFCNQSRLLTSLATPWLEAMDGAPPSGEDAAKIGQFRTLTVPGGMGGKFHALGLWSGMNPPAEILPGFALGTPTQAAETLGIS